jgi:hypothetical protein
MMIDIKRLRKFYTDTSTIDVENVDITVTYHKVAKDLENRFTPHQSKEYFKKCDKCLKIHVAGDTQLTYYVYYDKKADVPPMAKLIESFQQASAVMQYFGITKYINIYIIMAPFKRLLPQNGETLTPDHINGGYTHHLGNEIFIIRSEEFSKVILHEILHHCSDVHSEAWTNKHIDMLKAKFDIAKSTLLIPNEAVVELWATVMHCMFLCFEYGIDFMQLLKFEFYKSMQLCNKVYKMQQKMPAGWYEHTNAYAYIVFKTILLKHILSEGLTQNAHLDPESVARILLDSDTRPFYVDNNARKSLRMMTTSDF